MTWKPHWCEHAQKIAQENGWGVGENAKGQLVFISPDHEHSEPVDFGAALKVAAEADRLAAESIDKVAAICLASDAATKKKARKAPKKVRNRMSQRVGSRRAPKSMG